jgi:hypothetical protein
MQLSYFFAGLFLCNAIPHLASGLCGLSFPTPFARPRGVGRSSPLANFLWGLFNVVTALFLLSRHPFNPLSFGTPSALFFAGALLLGLYLSRHFEKVQKSSGGA